MVADAEEAGDYSLERCWWCGTPFPPRGAKVYCSTYCRRAAWWILNPDALKQASARFRENHPERAREIARQAYEKHREIRLAQSALWARANQDRKSVAEARRRAAKLSAGGAGVDPAAWLGLVAAAEGRCTYCGEVRPLTMDHRIPLIRGGRHEIENIIPACKPCNSRKHTRTEEEFRAFLRQE
jgi:5-methylcytosine-specific restriction endonuclease McrA